MAESFDFQINDLKFRAATSDKFPYARATAPFRKEQFDAAATVGDQSLSGWWTRGQLSFHKGAGLKYYEVLEGEVILNRFDTSLGVDALDTPGEAVPFYGLGDFTTTALTTKLTWAGGVPVQFGSDKIAFVQNGVLYSATSNGAAASEAMVDGTSVDVICSAPGRYAAYVGTTGKSIERHVNTAGAARLYTHTEAFDAIFFEKERLWVIDALGDLYALAPDPAAPPVAIAAGDKVVSLGRAGASWSMTATPADAYLADSAGTIYRITLQDDGSVPVISVPIVAAVLPEGERINFIKAHLGMVVIGTSRGLRVALVDSTGGLVYGPLHDVGACGSTAVLEGTSVWFVAGAELDPSTGTNYLTEVNLAEPVADLVFAWARWVAADPSGYTGAVACDGEIGFWRGTDSLGWTVGEIKTSGRGSAYLVGSLTTAYHRMGTLDAKHFQEVLVRAKGTGTIEVFRVDADGSETSLGVMNAVDGQQTFPFDLTVPVERVALRFEMTADVDGPPVLLGYQIKALPSPVRQRLIKWPLMIQDVVKDRYGVSRGTREGAWAAWSELEALEETDALVTFTDHRTGETGEAFIESLELQTDTPTRGANSGFGGVGYATLRKVS